VTIRHLAVAALVAQAAIGLSAQSPTAIDTSKIGPRIGAVAPAFEGVDQFGKTRTLASIAGRRGTMLVFFRSANW
jgi:cytochrome oxidase Cu insertion factor (SCO1/SenC/PrrC family)